MKHFPRLRSTKNALLILALLALTLPLLAFSSARQVVAQGPKLIQDVFITNTDANPVPVTGSVNVAGSISAADNPALQPFTQKLSFVVKNHAGVGSAESQVPAGKRLVIETVTAVIYVSRVGEPTPSLWVTIGSANHPFQPVFAPLAYEAYGYEDVPEGLLAPDGLASWIVNQPTTLYADPGSTVRVFLHRTPYSHDAGANVHIVGHLVDLPEDLN